MECLIGSAEKMNAILKLHIVSFVGASVHIVLFQETGDGRTEREAVGPTVADGRCCSDRLRISEYVILMTSNLYQRTFPSREAGPMAVL